MIAVVVTGTPNVSAAVSNWPTDYDGNVTNWPDPFIVQVSNWPTAPKTPTRFVPFSALDVSSETTVWTPASGKKFRLMGYVVTQGTLTGDITLRDDTAGAVILVIPANTVGISQVNPPMGDGILSSTIDHVLTAEGESTETISGYVFGTED